MHAFVNCQDLRLTANRGSIDNTPSEILEDLRKAVQEIYNEIIQGDDWIDLEWLDSEVTAYNTAEKEKILNGELIRSTGPGLQNITG